MKPPHRRRFLRLAAGAAAVPAVSRTARAQAYVRNKIKHFYKGLRSLETVMPTKSTAALILVLGFLVAGLPLHAAPATQYEEVKDWPKLRPVSNSAKSREWLWTCPAMYSYSTGRAAASI
jgi:hypothetical protein